MALLLLTALLAAPSAYARTLSASAAAGQTTVSLTFDDGTASENAARPVLSSHGMHGTFYLNSSKLGTDGYLTWAQVAGLAADGNEIGGHTSFHIDVTQADTTEAQRQICNDRASLLNAGYQVTDFAYPYGAFNASVQSIVQSCGYNSARSSNQFTPPPAESIPPQDQYAIREAGTATTGVSVAQLESYVTQVEQSGGGWAPIVFHQICNACDPYSITQANLQAFLDWLQPRASNGTVVKTVREVIGGAVQPAVLGPPAPPPPNGSNAVRNASLEQDTNTDQAPDCWTFDNFGNQSYTWSRTTDAHSGTKAERVDVTNYQSGDDKLIQVSDLGNCTPSVAAGRQYRITAWYKSSAAVNFTAFTRSTGTGTFSFWASSPSFPASSTWRQAIWVTDVIPSGVDGLTFGLAISSNGFLTVDDLGMDDAAASGGGDTTQPTVTLTSPTPGATVAGTVPLAASASDNVEVDHVDFLVDGSVVGSSSRSPYSYNWNAVNVSGSHTISARAVDTAGNSRTTAPITVTVSNSGTNVLQNPSLETATGSTPNCWLLGGFGTNTFAWTRTSDAHSGSWAENLNITSWTNGDRKLVNTQDTGACAPAATPGHAYTVTAWYKSATSPRMFAYYRSSGGVWTYWATSPAFPASASSWAQATWVSPTVPAGATNLSVGMGLVAGGSVTMDDFTLLDNSPLPDTTAPTSAITCASDSEDQSCSSNWYPASVPISLAAADNQGGSGVKEIRYTTDGSTPTATTGTVYGGAFALTATTTIKWRAIDNAGNLEAVHAQVIQVDATPPTTTIQCNGSACGNSFFGGSVSVSLTATDGGSGVDQIRYTADGSDPRDTGGNVYLGAFSVASTTTVKYAAFDRVGNAEGVNSKLIQVDTTAPTTTSTCNGAPCSSSNYTGPVSVALAASDDPGGSGVQQIRYTTNGTDPTSTTGTVYSAPFTVSSNTTIKYRAFDNAGNAEPVNSSQILIDGTPPTTTISCNGASCSSDYYNAAVSVTLTASDAGSGVASIRYTNDGTDPTATNGFLYVGQFLVVYTRTLKYRAFDNAGNAEPVNSQLIQVDSTAPAATLTSLQDGATVSGTATLTANASDDSGVTSVDFLVDGETVGTDTTAPYSYDWDSQSVADGAHTIAARAVDVAGNTATSTAASVTTSNAPDTTPPTSTISCNGAACSSSYYSAAVSVTLAATDNQGGSGVQEIRYTTDGTDPTPTTGTVYDGAFTASSTTTVRYRAIDNADNAEALNSRLIQVDTTAPTVTLDSPSDGEIVMGTVTLQATAGDDVAIDHVDFRVDGQTVGTDTTAPYSFDWNSHSVPDGSHTVVARAVDEAGNTTDSAGTSVTVTNLVTLDTTPPTSTIKCNGAACSDSFYGAAVSVTLTATDDSGGSGVKEIRYTTDGTDPTPSSGTVYSGAFTVGATTTVKYSAFDNAGNAEDVNSQLIHVDVTAPATTIACNGAACSGSFYNAAVSVTLDATDAGSGVAQIRYTTNGSNPTATTGTVYTAAFNVSSTTTVKYRAFDNVGNAEAVQSQLIRIDTTPPSASLTNPPNGVTVSGTVNLVATASDNVAIDHVDFLVDGNTVATDSTSPYSVNWNSSSVPDGSHAIAARAVDSAGNATTSTARTVTTANAADTTAPTSTISCNGNPCATGFYNAAVSVTLAATDNAGGSGLKEIRYTTDGSTPTATTGTVYTGAFSVASTATVKYRAFDNAGNAEAVNSQAIQIDGVPPTSTISCNGAACSSSFYKTSVSVTLAASDTGGSGVSQIRYTTDGTDPTATTGTVYTAAFTVNSTTTVKYRAFDNAGNAEAVNSPQIKVDTTAPTTTIACSGNPCGSGFFNAAVSVSLTATDDAGGSGVNQIRYTTNGTDPTSTTGTVYSAPFNVSSTTTVKYRAFDVVGNAEAVKTQAIQFDTTAPTVSLTSPAAGAALIGTVTLTATAADNNAVDHVDFRVDGQTVGTDPTSPYSFDWNSQSVADGSHTIVARAVDSAGNATSTSGTAIVVTNGPNLLQNPSLETATGSTPNCWLLGGFGTNTFTWTRVSDAHTGSWGENLNMTAFTSGDRKLVNAQDAGACAPAAVPGHTYTVTVWYKSATTPRIFAYYRSSSGVWTYWATSNAFPASASSWAQATWVSPALPAGATNLSVGMGLVATGSVTMDDFGLFDNH